ncbi:uncharacterized protein B0H18DRAFT_895841 [Fomitopsis serialis]|uniref:uncharacterized protein n=1 Tax=Fomitopsis serialis TaxID=139415 RepID=UPI002007C096|nr:uncharacterized protein B0H18DRAFT_895841 [Neoantrodia serialis]KAH9910394.1 hypothetical protein B0H18DRAFT_895841 [Neoantrodia serialis]
MPSIQSNASVRPNGELSSSATASPHGILYSNGAAATGFAIGTPYQPYLPSGSYRWYPQAAWYPHAGLPQVRALHVGEGSVPLGVVLAYRGSHCRRMFFDPQWDDAQLLTEMRKTYDKLRSWRRWCSLKNVRSITLVKLSQDTFVFPQRIGPTKVSTRQHMRLRFLLDHPEALLGRRDFTTALMTRPDIGIEFVERWQATRLTIAVVGLVCFSLIVSLLYAWITKDVSTAFTIGAYITSAFSIILVLIGVLGFVDL